MSFSEAFSPVRAIEHGLEGLKRQPAGLLLGGFLMLVTQGGGGSGGGGPGDSDLEPEARAALAFVSLVVVGVGLCLALVFWIARSFLHTGWLRLHRDLVVDGQGAIGLLFSGADTFVRMALWKLLATAISFGVALAAALPGGALLAWALLGDDPEGPLTLAGAALIALFVVPAMIYVRLGLALGTFVVALDGAAPMDALSRSWELADGHRLTLLWFFVVTGLFTALGFLACCVGVFATFPIAELGLTEAYLLATREGLVSRLEAKPA